MLETVVVVSSHNSLRQKDFKLELFHQSLSGGTGQNRTLLTSRSRGQTKPSHCVQCSTVLYPNLEVEQENTIGTVVDRQTKSSRTVIYKGCEQVLTVSHKATCCGKEIWYRTDGKRGIPLCQWPSGMRS
jgi:hypothetical protein